MIGEHVSILETCGAVWLGKFGKALAEKHIVAINEQVERNQPAYLYLVRRDRVSRSYRAFRGSVVEMTRPDLGGDWTDPADEPELVPTYYEDHGLWEQVGFWTKLSGIVPLPAGGLSNIQIKRSGMPLADTLRVSVAGMFIVTRGGRP